MLKIQILNKKITSIWVSTRKSRKILLFRKQKDFPESIYATLLWHFASVLCPEKVQFPSWAGAVVLSTAGQRSCGYFLIFFPFVLQQKLDRVNTCSFWMCTEHSCKLFSPRGTWRWLVSPDSASSSLRWSSCRLVSRVRLRVELWLLLSGLAISGLMVSVVPPSSPLFVGENLEEIKNRVGKNCFVLTILVSVELVLNSL